MSHATTTLPSAVARTGASPAFDCRGSPLPNARSPRSARVFLRRRLEFRIRNVNKQIADLAIEVPTQAINARNAGVVAPYVQHARKRRFMYASGVRNVLPLNPAAFAEGLFREQFRKPETNHSHLQMRAGCAPTADYAVACSLLAYNTG